jgi:hypothetical protein
MLLDASSGLFGGVNNLAFNGAGASSGNLLIVPTSGEHAPSISGIDASGRSAQTASDSLFAQDQPNAQLRLFGVNSQGEGSRLPQTTANILRDAYGFGSGAMPNAPWMPNAYNLGLANHQFGYPSQSDMGFSSVPPWFPVAQFLPKDESQFLDKNQSPPSEANGEAAEEPEQLAAQPSLREQEQSPQDRLDKDAGEPNEDLNMLWEQPACEKLSDREAAGLEDGSIPDSLWLSALPPAPMAALIAGLPGMAAAAEGGEIGAQAAE